MLLHPNITEVWERTEQGMTRPFHCGADDGHSYYVKSRGALWRSLVCEWVAGRLAEELALPIAPFAQVQVDDAFELILSARGEHDLAAGLAFGSRIAEHTREFEPSLLARCDPGFRRDLVAFDWWVRNADRTLGVLSGNPNLLWNTEMQAPVVIDHNMAFDRASMRHCSCKPTSSGPTSRQLPATCCCAPTMNSASTGCSRALLRSGRNCLRIGWSTTVA